MSVAQYYLLDTFARVPFKGNPTPVCLLTDELSTQTMFMLAEEFNAPVTAFVATASDELFKIRYFTGTGEIPACGHATLGAAHILLNQNPDFERIVFVTIEGVKIIANKERDLVYLVYPVYERKDYEIPGELLEALGVEQIASHFYCDELESLFIELKDDSAVRSIRPDFEKLRKSSDEVKEVVIMSESKSDDADFILRSFCPWIGIDEDPVTGSIHSVLGPYWKERTGKTELIAFQASKRSGEIFIQVTDNSVKIGGPSKILVDGTLDLS
ncbi:PhzF family phenazine biosynthesis protein [Poritiphilus flavus]|uniref:PhzF family phenazine biosynthesis isomerase n=1 Tax=Poritiphilus flavus TaxID=2697053 RepID=A0A6L9E7B1_9FLAO|nr:PhzF family phenazine biosynthesis protein [Poritiphilus flavus]NAS10531.1 PhzF family phenazine biosynthesis isomerase [Poritiphilus flavus]